jgi:hypothetical protein
MWIMLLYRVFSVYRVVYSIHIGSAGTGTKVVHSVRTCIQWGCAAGLERWQPACWHGGHVVDMKTAVPNWLPTSEV